jgi:AraC family transcriptional regulator
VFTHHDHVSKIKSTWNAIFGQWLPGSGYEVTDAPEIEYYGEDFDPRNGTGTIEIWVPVRGLERDCSPAPAEARPPKGD